MSNRQIYTVEHMQMHLRARIRDLSHEVKPLKGAPRVRVQGALDEVLALYRLLGGGKPRSVPNRYRAADRRASVRRCTGIGEDTVEAEGDQEAWTAFYEDHRQDGRVQVGDVLGHWCEDPTTTP